MTTINEADAIKLGGLTVDAVYLAGTKVWPAESGFGPAERMFADIVPDSQDGDGDYTLGVYFTVINTGWITHARYFNAGVTATHACSLWQVDTQVQLASIYDPPAVGGWREVEFPLPVEVQTGIQYCLSYGAGPGKYAYSPTTPASLTPNLQVDGTYYASGQDFLPQAPATPYDYHADVVYHFGG